MDLCRVVPKLCTVTPTENIPKLRLGARGLPAAWIVQEGFDFGQGRGVEGVLHAGFGQHIPPGAKVMQGNPVIGQTRLGIRKIP